MGGNRELLEIGEQAELKIRMLHLARAVSSTLAKAPVPWPSLGADHQTVWLPGCRFASTGFPLSGSDSAPGIENLRQRGTLGMAVDLPRAQMSGDNKLQDQYLTSDMMKPD